MELKDIRDYFGYATLKEFAADWKALSEKERAQIRGGIEDGSYNY